MTITSLRPGDTLPKGEPARYPDKKRRGYVRLRWKVAPYTYVEVYEHRVKGGVVVDEPVFHLNGRGGDNRKRNLWTGTREERLVAHLRGLDLPGAKIKRLWDNGWTVDQIAEDLDESPPAIAAALRTQRCVGVLPQGPTGAVLDARWTDVEAWLADEVRFAEIARRLGLAAGSVDKYLRARGVTVSFPPGNYRGRAKL